MSCIIQKTIKKQYIYVYLRMSTQSCFKIIRFCKGTHRENAITNKTITMNMDTWVISN